jgi:hypothetical protein
VGEALSLREADLFSTCPGLLRARQLWIKAGLRFRSPLSPETSAQPGEPHR